MKNFYEKTSYKILISLSYSPTQFIQYQPNGKFSLDADRSDRPFDSEESARKHLGKLLACRHDEIGGYRIIKTQIITLEEVIHEGKIDHPATEKHCLHCGETLPWDATEEFCTTACRMSYRDCCDPY